MSTKKSPFTRTVELYQSNEKHESKAKLVDALVGLLGNISEVGSKEDLKGTLLAVSNKKLLRLMEVGTEIKSKFGSVDKAAEALAKTLGRAKDGDYVTKLKSYGPAKLLDLYRSAEKRAKKAA